MWLEGLPGHKQEDTEGTLWGSGEAAWAPWAASGRGPGREGEEPAGDGGGGPLAPTDAGGRPARFALRSELLPGQQLGPKVHDVALGHSTAASDPEARTLPRLATRSHL